MTEKPSDRKSQVDALFARALPVLAEALATDYGLSESELLELEENLYHWFDRLARRPGEAPVPTLRGSLLLAACRFARGLCQMKAEAFGGKGISLEAPEPIQLAAELEIRLRQREKDLQ